MMSVVCSLLSVVCSLVCFPSAYTNAADYDRRCDEATELIHEELIDAVYGSRIHEAAKTWCRRFMRGATAVSARLAVDAWIRRLEVLGDED